MLLYFFQIFFFSSYSHRILVFRLLFSDFLFLIIFSTFSHVSFYYSVTKRWTISFQSTLFMILSFLHKVHIICSRFPLATMCVHRYAFVQSPFRSPFISPLPLPISPPPPVPQCFAKFLCSSEAKHWYLWRCLERKQAPYICRPYCPLLVSSNLRPWRNYWTGEHCCCRH